MPQNVPHTAHAAHVAQAAQVVEHDEHEEHEEHVVSQPLVVQLDGEQLKLQPLWHATTAHPDPPPWPTVVSVSEQFTVAVAASAAKPESARNITCCELIAIVVISLPVVDATRLSTWRATRGSALERRNHMKLRRNVARIGK